MALTVGSTNTATGTSTSAAVTIPGTPANGDGLIMSVASETANHTGPGGAWVQADSERDYEATTQSVWFLACSGGESGTVTVGMSSSVGWAASLTLIEGNGGTVAVADTGYDEDAGGDPNPSATAGTGDVAAVWAVDSYSADGFAIPASYTEEFDIVLDIGYDVSFAMSYRESLASGTAAPVMASGGNTESSAILVIFTDTGPSASVTQSGSRFYADDAAPATSTALAAEDTDITGRATETATQLRVQLDATGDPATNAYKLQWRVVGDADTEWEDLA